VVSVQPHGGAKLGGGRGAPLDREYVWLSGGARLADSRPGREGYGGMLALVGGL